MSITHCGFFLLRTPLLPFGETQRWGDDLLCADSWRDGAGEELTKQTWRHDIDLLRGRLRQMVHRPEVMQALAIASPSLLSAISIWERDPECKKGLQAERSLVRYFLRMSSRPTPFGLFSGCSVGKINPQGPTELELAPRECYRSSTRLDFDYLFALTAELRLDPVLQSEMRYGWNSSLQRIGNNWHYVESQPFGTVRTHHLIKLASDEYLDRVLAAAKFGNQGFGELRKTIRSCEGSETLEDEEIDVYLREIINSEILVANVSPTLTGKSALDALLDELKELPSATKVYRTLSEVRDSLSSFDHRQLGVDPEEYSVITTQLQALPAKVNEAHLLQVDMFKPVTKASLGQAVLDELYDAINFLDKVVPVKEPPDLALFRDAFTSRYDDEWVPLVEALDWEAGIGYGQTSSAGGSPLLRGLQLDSSKDLGDITLNRFQSNLLQKVMECAKVGENEIELRDEDFGAQKQHVEARLPESFCVITSLVAPSIGALQNGNFELIYKGGFGPSSARLLGRFCSGDNELDRLVRDALREEESFDPEAVYAEIVYLPEGRIGNVLCRPVLRDYEIVHLGRSGASIDRQLPAADLMVTIRGGKIVLYSQRLRRRIVPRMTNGHNYTRDSVSAIYRFLCDLQNEGGVRVPGLHWGFMSKLSALPRIRKGRVILACAQWRISGEESAAFLDLDRQSSFLRAKKLQRDRGLPRHVWLSEGDNTLPVDFDNPLSVDAFLHLLKRSREVVLVEMYPQNNLQCVTGPEGGYEHELILPLSKKRATSKSAPTDVSTRDETIQHVDLSLNVLQTERLFPPGSDWQFVKIYGGEASLDDVLIGEFANFLSTLADQSLITRWFFIRYSDPELHLRLRFQTQNHDASLELLKAINAAFIDRRLWRVQFDTYRREVVRYGGLEGVKAAEEIFWADSEAVLTILRGLESRDGLDERWRIAILGIDTLFTDFGFNLEDRLRQVSKLRSAFAKEFGLSFEAKEKIGGRFRRERGRLQEMMRGEINHKDPSAALAMEAFAERSRRIRSVVSDILTLEQNNSLETNLSDIIGSIVHMHVNRLLRSSHRAHECVLYDFLYRIYDSDRALMNKAKEDRPST